MDARCATSGLAREGLVDHTRDVRDDQPGTDPTVRLFKRTVVLLLLIFVGWLLFAWLLVPALIRLAHDGTSIPLLSSFMAGRESTPLAAYVGSWAPYRDGGTKALFLLALAATPLALTLPSAAGRRRDAGPQPEGGYGTSIGFILAGVILVVCGSMPLLVYVDAVTHVYAVTEDSWAEYGTFVVFGMAGILFLWTAMLEPGWKKAGLLAFAAAALFVALEEISWGQRIIGIGTPEVLEGYNRQGETTIHNLHGVWFPGHRLVAAGLVVFAILLPVLRRRWDSLDHLIERFGLPVPPLHLWPVFLVTAVFLADPLRQPRSTLDEVSELALGLSFLILALDTALRVSGGWRGAKGLGLPAAGASLAVAALVTVGTVQWTPPSSHLSWRFNEMAAFRLPDKGLTDQAKALFEHMETRPELRTERTRVEYGRLLLSLGERDRAERVLNQAMRDLEGASPGSAVASARRLRHTAEIYSLLGQSDAADSTLREALSLTEVSLREAQTATDSAEAHWWAAWTLAGMGRVEAAIERANQACERSDMLSFHARILFWARRLGDVEDQLPECIGL